MIRPIVDLCWELRGEGLPVSTDQSIALARALALVGLADVSQVARVVAACVATTKSDAARATAVVGRFFSVERAHAADFFGRLRARGFQEGELDGLRELLEAARRAGADAARGIGLLTAPASELDHLLHAAGLARDLARLHSPLQAGFFAQRAAGALGASAAGDVIARLEAAIVEQLGETRGRALGRALREELDGLRARIRQRAASDVERRAAEPDATAPLADRPIASLHAAEAAIARRGLRALGEKLRGGERVRARRARRGRIDPHKTLRAAVATHGVPMRIVRKRRARGRPKLVLACDLSDSVRAHHAFVLEFANAAHAVFEETRTFIFVSDLVETTALFEKHKADDALARIASGRVITLAASSNYARALDSLERAIAPRLDRRTTVVILGDGRTNYLGDGITALRRMRARARAILWVSPEGPGSWTRGDSAMARYASVASRVLLARTWRELERAARAIAARRS